MDPEVTQQVADKFPVLEQWPAVMVIVTVSILVVLVRVSARLARAAFALAEKIGGLNSTIDNGFESVKAEIRATTDGVIEMGHKLDRNTDLVNDTTKQHFDLLVDRIEVRAEDRMHKLRVDLDRVYPPANGDRMSEDKE